MEHSIPLITTLAEGFGMALVLGFVAERIKVPALVGYLFAGILIGPATPGVVADVKLASELSEIGVMLLMFGVGLHFSLRDLLDVKRLAVPGAMLQMALATAMGMLVAWLWGWSWGSGLVFGLSLSCASTVVLLKALEARGALETQNGRIAVGWLVVEDLATVLVLVLLPPLAGVLGGQGLEQGATGMALWLAIGKTLLEVAVFIALMLAVGRRVLPWLLWQVARTGSREMFTLAVVAVAIGIAYGAAQLFHVSFALGAFFAGMVMRESEFSHRAAEESLPLRDAFSVLFFVAVGMLFDPSILIREPLHVLGVLLIIMLGKSLVSMALVMFLRYPLTTALTVSASLAQIGEFSFILAGLGVSLGLLPPEGMSLILAGAILSIALNPVLFAMIEPLRKWVLARSALARKLEASGDPYAELPVSTERKYLDGQVVLAGYGRVGRRVAADLAAHAIPMVVAELSRERVEDLRGRGQAAVLGDAAEPGVLIQAHIAHAAMLVSTLSDPVGMRKMVDTARTLNPEIEIVLIAQSEDEMRMLRDENIGEVFLGDEQLARGLAGHVRSRFAQ
jgi:CPA2 family monovalent cation:H+ antiporter-2